MKRWIRAVILMGSLGSAAGCSLLLGPPPQVAYEARTGAPSRAPVPADRVAMINAKDDLPEGFTRRSDFTGMGRRTPADALILEDNFPTADDPHQILGSLTVDKPEGSKATEAEMFQLLAQRAGEQGATAVVIVSLPQGRSTTSQITGVALYVSETKARSDFPPAAELLAKEPAMVPNGGSREEPITRQLDDFKHIVIEGKRGTCYALAIALDKEAKLSARAREHLKLAVTGKDDEERSKILGSDLTSKDRKFEQGVGCPQVDGPISIELQTSSEDLGKGPVQFVVHTWPIDEAALADKAKAHEEAVENDKKRHEARIKKSCAHCRDELDICLGRGRTGCVSDYESCLSRANVSRRKCPR